MAFLDNSGDIILDAVLTDTGRMRLAQGNGSFKISKFALGDDEINYELYDKNHASGSAYFDLQVMQTPVLEAFTNNTSNLKTKLISISRTNILYMPVLKINENIDADAGNEPAGGFKQSGASQTFKRPDDGGTGSDAVEDAGRYYVAVDRDTYEALRSDDDAGIMTAPPLRGVLQGYTPANGDPSGTSMIRVDQGLDTAELPASLGMDSDLLETAYIVEMDYRMGRVKPTHGQTDSDMTAPVNFIDDDNIASYYVTDTKYVNPYGQLDTHFYMDGTKEDYTIEKMNVKSLTQVFAGPRGSTLHFRVQASQELQTSTYLFTQVGQTQLVNSGTNILGMSSGNDLVAGKTIYYIDSTVRVIGANTGFRLDIPVRYVKIA